MHPKTKYGSGSKTGDFDTAAHGSVKPLEGCASFKGKNQNVRESRLDGGGHDSYRGKRGRKGSTAKSTM